MTIPIEKITRFSVSKDTDYLYLFTDNLNRTSGNNEINNQFEYYIKYSNGNQLYYPNKTQAVIRGLKNAYPISTMYNQYKKSFNDWMFDLFKENLDNEILTITENLYKYNGIKYVNKIFGVGTYSQMNETAPLCFSYLHEKLKEININQL